MYVHLYAITLCACTLLLIRIRDMCSVYIDLICVIKSIISSADKLLFTLFELLFLFWISVSMADWEHRCAAPMLLNNCWMSLADGINCNCCWCSWIMAAEMKLFWLCLYMPVDELLMLIWNVDAKRKPCFVRARFHTKNDGTSQHHSTLRYSRLCINRRAHGMYLTSSLFQHRPARRSEDKSSSSGIHVNRSICCVWIGNGKTG